MSTGIIIQARLGSTRLPGKVLKEVYPGVTMLEYMVDRVKAVQHVESIIVATTTEDGDDPIYELCLSKGIECFRGSENNVLKRYYDCALEYGFKTVVRLTSDCPLVDPGIIEKCIDMYNHGGYDYFSNTCPPALSKYPDGSDVEVFSYSSLELAHSNASSKSDREHVTFYFWKHGNPMFKCGILESDDDYSDYRYTVDYPEDFEVIKFLASQIRNKNISGSVSELAKILEDNPGIKSMNSSYYAGIGWEKKDEK